MTNREPSCPLCENASVEILESFAAAEISRLYRNSVGVDVSAEFNGEPLIQRCFCARCDLRFFRPQISGSEAFYNRLQSQAWYYRSEKPEFEIARRWIQPSDSVLEIGGGAGAFARDLHVARYTGLELSRDAIERAAGTGLTLLAEPVEEHARTHARGYDVVCAFQVLEHVVDVRTFVHACVQCVRPGGRLIFAVPSADSFLSLCRNNATNLPPHHLTQWSDTALRSVARLFPLRLLDLVHDEITARERRWLAEAIAQRYLDQVFHRRERSLDLGLTSRLLSRAGSVMAGPLSRALPRNDVFVRGASVTAIYQRAPDSVP